MPITSNLAKIVIRFRHLGQQCENVGYYEPAGAAWLLANGTQGAEAYWDNIKDRWRALYTDDSETVTTSVLFEEIGGALSFGEFAVPTEEQHGTRESVGLGDYLPAYVAVGIRLSVSTRATRPGQKRIAFATESDNAAGIVDPAFLTLVEDAADIWSTNLVLGAPVLAGALVPLVVHFPTTEDPDQRQQEVVGHVVNDVFTSQVSRRPGHGT